MSVIPLKISAILLRISAIDLKRYNLFHDISGISLQDIFNHLKMGVIPLKIAAIDFFKIVFIFGIQGSASIKVIYLEISAFHLGI